MAEKRKNAGMKQKDSSGYTRQDKRRRQAPDIIAQLWDKTRLDNLDIQAETVIKPLETVSLLGLLTSLTNQS
jgi:hypothetical protein